MRYETYTTTRRNYRGLDADSAPAPVVNLSLHGIAHQSSARFDGLKAAMPASNTARLQTIQLAGGGEIKIQNNSGTAAEAARKAKDKLAELGINRTPIIEIKNARENLKGADLTNTVITGKGGADLTGAKMRGATIYGMGGGITAPKADMSNTTIRDSRLDGSQMRGVSLAGAKFTGDNSAVGVKAQNADLRGADFGGAHLTHADMGGAKLGHTSMRGSQMAYASLAGAKGDLDMSYAEAEGVNLRKSSLKPNFNSTNLRGADTMSASIDGAAMEGAQVDEKTLYGAMVTAMQGTPAPAPKAAASKNDAQQPGMSYYQRAMRLHAAHMSGPAPV